MGVFLNKNATEHPLPYTHHQGKWSRRGQDRSSGFAARHARPGLVVRSSVAAAHRRLFPFWMSFVLRRCGASSHAQAGRGRGPLAGRAPSPAAPLTFGARTGAGRSELRSACVPVGVFLQGDPRSRSSFQEKLHDEDVFPLHGKPFYDSLVSLHRSGDCAHRSWGARLLCRGASCFVWAHCFVWANCQRGSNPGDRRGSGRWHQSISRRHHALWHGAAQP